MKKFITFALIFCMVVAMVFVFHEPVRCSDSDPTLVGPDDTTITVLVVVGVLLLIGIPTLVCTLNSNDAKEKDIANISAFTSTWNSRIGNWTFDDALALWGTPTSVTQGDSISVVVYNKTSTPNLGTHTTYYQGNWLNPPTSESNTVYGYTTGDYYTFIFDKNTKMLKKWNIAHYGAAGHSELSDSQPALKQTEEKKGDSPPSPASSLKQKLEELKKLLDSGVITKEEYNKTRGKLIDSFQ